MEQTLSVDGLRTRYQESGDGPPVVLLHGASLGSSLEVWQPVLARLASRGLRVIAFDQPGFGRTDPPADASLAYRRRFVLAFLDALGLTDPCLLGHSQSGAIAVRLALERPERARAVVAVGTASLLPPAGSTRAADGERDLVREPTLDQTRALLERDVHDRSRISPELVAARYAQSLGANFEAFQRRRLMRETEAGGGEPLWRRLGELRVPALFIYGAEDRDAAARAAEARLLFPGMGLRVLDRSGHLVHWDAPEEFVAVVGDFVRVSAARSG